jgi:hypothetical protein
MRLTDLSVAGAELFGKSSRRRKPQDSLPKLNRGDCKNSVEV